MPRRDEVHPDCDGRAEVPFSKLTPEQRLDCAWTTMQLLRAARRSRPSR